MKPIKLDDTRMDIKRPGNPNPKPRRPYTTAAKVHAVILRLVRAAARVEWELDPTPPGEDPRLYRQWTARPPGLPPLTMVYDATDSAWTYTMGRKRLTEDVRLPAISALARLATARRHDNPLS